MTVDEKIEEIVKNYKCSDAYGDGCWGNCKECEQPLREDLLELVEMVKARDEELKSMLQTQDRCYEAGREDMLIAVKDWMIRNSKKYIGLQDIAWKMCNDLGKDYCWVIKQG